MAKLERGEGIDNIDSILPEVDSVMVARGDLGVEISDGAGAAGATAGGG